ncbi:retrovirus-related Pol polyprotein from transposon 17.6 [Trichonephila clavipes]|nr:retrovirus-related Pol polyprotein from transposon 17.6 [Trichonephila clavipes]
MAQQPLSLTTIPDEWQVVNVLHGFKNREKGEERKREREKEGKRARKRQGLVVLGSGEENPRALLGDADQESEARMSKNALRTGRRQAVELKKGHLLEVARELGVEVNGDQTKVEIKDMILQSDKNYMETTKAVMEGILEEKEREFEERRQTREYELERSRSSNATETVSVSSADLEGKGQAKKEKVAEDRWVSQLIPLLPIEIAEIVVKEPLEKSDDYPHIKNLLLARFQLTPIAFRDRFESPQRRPGAMWAELVFELRSYLDNWLAGMKVDSWDGFKEAKSLAEKLDHFEAIRRVHKKQVRRKPGSVEPLINSLSKVKINQRILVGGEDDSFIIPAFEGEGGKSLAKVNGVEFKEEQRKCPDLKPLWDKALTGIDKEFRRRGAVRQNLRFVSTSRETERKAKAPLKLVPIISEVFSKINIDAVGPLPVSTKQNRYLITSICVASKYPEAIPVESITSPSVIDALLSIFSKLGFPREIQSDLGTSFTSELTTTFFNKFGIKVTRSSVSHPQSNAVERVHRTIKRVIKALCVESEEDWEGVLPLALFSLRTVAHESTGFSLTELVVGKNLRTPQTLVYEEWMEEGNTSQSVVEYILQLNNRLKRCQDIAITRMKECQLKRKTWYDRDAVERKFVEGDLVMVLATSKQNKLEVNWIGLGKVLSRISDTNYVIDLPGRRDRSTIYHVNLLKPYHRRPELVSLVVKEVSDDIEGDAEIPYPDKQCTKFDYHEILRESQLQLKLSPSQIDELKQVITKNKDVFSPDPGTTHLMRMNIELISDKPIKTKPYRMSPRQINILREDIKRLLELGVIEIGQSDYTSPLILVESPNKDPRPCVDYRRLNYTIRFIYTTSIILQKSF